MDTVDSLSKGISPLSEPGLDALISRNLLAGRLNFISDWSQVPFEFDYLWVTIDTPVDENDYADSAGVVNAIVEIVERVPACARIVISSQLPAGSTTRVRELIESKNVQKKLAFCYSPENLRLGSALDNFLNPDRIVVGADSQVDFESFEPLFQTISNRIVRMSSVSAELTKHALNTFLALSVAYANEIATIAENEGANAIDVARGLKTDIRIGAKAYLVPGEAFAGGTLARDVRYLEHKSHSYHISTPVIDAIIKSNETHSLWAQAKFERTFKDLSGIRVTLCGLAYKPDTYTLRRSRSVELGDWLLNQNVRVSVMSYRSLEIPSNWLNRIEVVNSVREAIQKSDALVVGPSYDLPKLCLDDLEDLDRKCDSLVLDAGRRWPELSKIKEIDYHYVGKSRA